MAELLDGIVGSANAIAKALSDANKDFRNSTSKFRKSSKSIVDAAKGNIFEFPVFIADSVPIDYAEATASLLEQVYASYLQTAISVNPVIDAEMARRGQQFNHLKSDTNKYLECVDYSDMPYAFDACHNEFIGEGYSVEFNMVNIEDYTATVINEALEYEPLSEFEHYFQEAYAKKPERNRYSDDDYIGMKKSSSSRSSESSNNESSSSSSSKTGSSTTSSKSTRNGTSDSSTITSSDKRSSSSSHGTQTSGSDKDTKSSKRSTSSGWENSDTSTGSVSASETDTDSTTTHGNSGSGNGNGGSGRSGSGDTETNTNTDSRTATATKQSGHKNSGSNSSDWSEGSEHATGKTRSSNDSEGSENTKTRSKTHGTSSDTTDTSGSGTSSESSSSSSSKSSTSSSKDDSESSEASRKSKIENDTEEETLYGKQLDNALKEREFDPDKQKMSDMKDANLARVKTPQLLDESKINKLNTMKPLMMSMDLNVMDKNGSLSQPVSYVVGVKCHTRLIDSSILPEVASYPLKEMNKATRKIRYKAGELKFHRDVKWAKKEKKQTAIDSRDPRRKWYRRLFELAHIEGDSSAAATVKTGKSAFAHYWKDKITGGNNSDLNHGVIPNATIVISKSDIDNINRLKGIDLLDGKKAVKFCKELFLISFVVIDTDQESIKMIIPDLHNDFEVHSIAAVNKQIAQLDTTGTKTRDIMKMLG